MLYSTIVYTSVNDNFIMDWGDFLAPWVPQLIQIIDQVALHEVAVFELGIVRNLILPYVCRHIYIYMFVFSIHAYSQLATVDEI